MKPKPSADDRVENGDGDAKTVNPGPKIAKKSVNLLYVQEKEYSCNKKTTPTKTSTVLSPAATQTKQKKEEKVNFSKTAKCTSGYSTIKTDNAKSTNQSQTNKKACINDAHKGAVDVSIKVGGSLDLEEPQEGITRFLGILLALIAALMFSMSALIIKVLGYHPFNLGVWRFAVMAIIPIPILMHSAIWGKQAFLEEIWPERSYTSGVLIMLQAILGANSILFTFFGLKYLNIADCIVIGTSAPVFVTFFAFIFLGERCGVFPVLTALLALFGVTIISKPPILTGEESLNEEAMIGVTSSFSSMLLLTVCYIVIRYLRKVHHALVNLCFGLWGFMQSVVMAILMDKLEVPSSYHEAGLIILSAALAFSAQTCVTLALKYEQAGPVALVRTTEVVFAFGWQALFLGVHPDVFSVVGALVTLSGVVLTSFRKIVMSLPEDDMNRRRFRFLLL